MSSEVRAAGNRFFVADRFRRQPVDRAAQGAQLQLASAGRAPRDEGHATAVFGQGTGVGGIGLGSPQRLGDCLSENQSSSIVITFVRHAVITCVILNQR